MKKQALLCFVLLSVGFLVAAAQTQPVKITVTNTKGKPLNKALISLKSAPHYRTPGKDGSLTVQALPNDTIFVTLDRYIGSIPVDASSDVAVAVAKGQMFKAENGKPTSTAYTVLTLPPFNQYDLTTMPNLHAYPDLKSFVTVRYPAVRIKDGEAYLLSSSAGRRNSRNRRTTIFSAHADRCRREPPAEFWNGERCSPSFGTEKPGYQKSRCDVWHAGCRRHYGNHAKKRRRIARI